MQAVNVAYGVSEEGMPQESHNDSEVIIPETSIPISPEQREQLIAVINPMDPSTNYGIEIYERALTLYCLSLLYIVTIPLTILSL